MQGGSTAQRTMPNKCDLAACISIELATGNESVRLADERLLDRSPRR